MTATSTTTTGTKTKTKRRPAWEARIVAGFIALRRGGGSPDEAISAAMAAGRINSPADVPLPRGWQLHEPTPRTWYYVSPSGEGYQADPDDGIPDGDPTLFDPFEKERDYSFALQTQRGRILTLITATTHRAAVAAAADFDGAELGTVARATVREIRAVTAAGGAFDYRTT